MTRSTAEKYSVSFEM